MLGNIVISSGGDNENVCSRSGSDEEAEGDDGVHGGQKNEEGMGSWSGITSEGVNIYNGQSEGVFTELPAHPLSFPDLGHHITKSG